MKQKLIAYKGSKCQNCGYDKPVPGAYHFHHRNPDEKEFNINANSKGYETLKKEVDKCDLLCANCHAEVHDLAWKESREDALILRKSKKVPRPCLGCNKEFLPKRKEQKYCCKSCSPFLFG